MAKVAKCAAGFRDSSPYSELFLNIYRVLLTRIKNGIFIWFSDKKTEEYFKEICIDKPDLQTNPPCRTVARQGDYCITLIRFQDDGLREECFPSSASSASKLRFRILP